MLASRAGSPRYAVGLTRVSTAEQGQGGFGLQAPEASVHAFCVVQGWILAPDTATSPAAGMTIGLASRRRWPGAGS